MHFILNNKDCSEEFISDWPNFQLSIYIASHAVRETVTVGGHTVAQVVDDSFTNRIISAWNSLPDSVVLANIVILLRIA